MLNQFRLWKSLTNNLDDIAQMDDLYKTKTQLKVDALLLQTNSDLKIEDANIADDDIILVEIPK